MRILDLFSGIGGFSLGLMAANFEDYDFTKFPQEQSGINDGYFSTAAFCEIDPAARAVLALRFPNIPILENVKAIDEATIKELGQIDIITGGFPCQDLSSSGKRAGLTAETRSGLFYEMMRICDIVKPKIIIFENVKELLKNEVYNQTFTKELIRSGYHATAFLLRASEWGLQHQRERAFILAYTDEKRYLPSREIFLAVASKTQRAPSDNLMAMRRVFSEKRKRRDFRSNGPDIRKDDGFSRAVVRFGLCGNALIPQIPYIFGKIIKECEAN